MKNKKLIILGISLIICLGHNLKAQTPKSKEVLQQSNELVEKLSKDLGLDNDQKNTLKKISIKLFNELSNSNLVLQTESVKKERKKIADDFYFSCDSLFTNSQKLKLEEIRKRDIIEGSNSNS